MKETRECKIRIVAAEAQGWTGPWRFGNEHLHGTPPNGKRKNPEGDHVPDAIDNLVKRLHCQINDLTLGIESVRALIDKSIGVAGLHQNGDLATWEDLEEGGEFEEWLIDFNYAEHTPNTSVTGGEQKGLSDE